jgi:hypothetical protein
VQTISHANGSRMRHWLPSEGEPMTWYAAFVTCSGCGQEHGAGLLQVPGGPARTGTVAELWPAGKLPLAVAEMLRDLGWHLTCRRRCCSR